MAGKWFLPRWWFYRPVMRLLHRLDLHWMPALPSIYDPDGTTRIQHWCQWCGGRFEILSNSRLEIRTEYQQARAATTAGESHE